MAGMTKVIANYTIDTSAGTFGLFTQDMVLSYKTRKLYIADFATQIDVVDAKTGKLLRTIPDDNAGFLAIDQRTNKIYATQYWDGTV
jgi:DNA-binding beta-propeller fold protein YncE